MASVASKRTRSKRRKHSPDILRMKRVARNLGILWREVCQLRDELRANELEERYALDDVRRYAWALFAGSAASPFWRGGFQRKFAKLIARGGDYTNVPRFDDCCQELKAICPQCSEWTLDDLWEFLTSDYMPLVDVMEHYREAVRLLTIRELSDASIVSVDESNDSTPF